MFLSINRFSGFRAFEPLRPYAFKPFIMKTKLLLSTLLILALSPVPCALSQIPQGFNYQAIARNTSGFVIQSEQIWMKVDIHKSDGTILWNEEHLLTTSSFGLVTFVVGTGPNLTGIISDFSRIEWSAQPLFLRTWVKYPVTGSYIQMGSTQILSVPYSLVAKDVEGPIEKLDIKGTEPSLDSALFEVKNTSGQTIFAVYNEGVRIYVDNGAKGPKGGFAVGGFDMAKGTKQTFLAVSDDSVKIYIDSNPLTKKAKGGFAVGGYDMAKGTVIQNLLDVDSDSVRVYVSDLKSDKGVKGGFAVGGFDASKGMTNKYFHISDDSARIYVKESPVKGVKGGFAVGSYDLSKGGAATYTSLTPDNYLIGHKSGSKMSDGKFNSFFGYETGLKNTTGNSNVFLGYLTGHENLSGSNNVAVGNYAGYGDTTGVSNVMLGDSAGYNNTASYNVLLGKGTGKSNKGDYNTFIGYQAGINNINGEHNVYLGYKAGYEDNIYETYGSYNVAVGNLSGYNGAGSGNVFLGDSSGYISQASNNVLIGKGTGKVTQGSYNVFMGYQAGIRSSGASNVFIGYRSAFKHNNGGDNVFIGSETGFNGFSLQRSVFIGPQAGKNVNTGADNIFIGDYAGRGVSTLATGNSNVFIGSGSGMNYSTGYNNVFIGKSTGYTLSSGYNNVMIGIGAGLWVGSGNSNVMLGSFAGTNTYLVADNTFVGSEAGKTNVSGVGNTYVGRSAGFTNKGKYNVFIGREAGYQQDTTSYKLFIQPNNSETPLIWGDFRLKYANINGNLGINTKTPSTSLHIKGNAGILALEGSDHAFVSFYPYGFAAGRKAYFGYPGAGSSSIALVNGVDVGNIVVIPGAGGYIGIGTGFPAYMLDVAGPANLNTGIAEGVALRVNGKEAIWFNGTYMSFGYDANYNHFAKPVTIGMFPPETNYYLQLPNASTKKAKAFAWDTYSDARIKTGQEELVYGLAELMKMIPRQYVQHDSEFNNGYLVLGDGQKNIGLIAQEVYKIIPEAVSKPANDSQELWGMDYNKLIPVVIKAVQDQQKEIESTKLENQQLKSELQLLRDEISQIKTLLAKEGSE